MKYNVLLNKLSEALKGKGEFINIENFKELNAQINAIKERN